MTAAMVVTPLRFVGGVIGLWTVTRLAILLPGISPPALDAPAKAGDYVAFDTPPPGRMAALAQTRAAQTPNRASFLSVPAEGSRNTTPAPLSVAAPPLGRPLDFARDSRSERTETRLSPSGVIAAGPPRAPEASRWSGSFYLFRRGDGGSAAIASGGQLGGSQTGARVAYRLDRAGRIAAAARLSSPLGDARGAEAAVGIDWHPLPSVPLRVSIERRIDLGGSGRHAWSAYAAGGFWRQAGRIVLDGYAQAGVVGARRRDLFADGALRAGHRTELGGARSLTIGAGAWAAAQPQVERLDLGPRVALGLPIGGTAATIAAEWRVRVAGDAAPRSGLALTLAADF